MSVMGLILLLTQLLMRVRSAQAVRDRTTSRASVGLVVHSRRFSAQNSIHPIGAREVEPIDTNNGRSLDAAAVPASAPSMIAAANAAPAILFLFRCIPVAPSLSVGPLFSQSL